MKTFTALCCVVACTAVSQQVCADQPNAKAQQERGHAVFQRWCEPCHGRAPYLPATAALNLKYQGRLPGALEDRKNLMPAAVKTFVREGVYSMPPFRKTEISDAELDALAQYLSRKTARR